MASKNRIFCCILDGVTGTRMNQARQIASRQASRGEPATQAAVPGLRLGGSLALLVWISALATLFLSTYPAWVEAATNGTDRSVLRLPDGDFLTGELQDCAQPDRLRWRSPAFSAPFEFDLAGVRSIRFSSPKEIPQPAGDFCFELAGGDLLFGALVGLSAEHVEIDTPHFGRIAVRRSDMVRLARWRNGAEFIYSGPNGLDAWEESPDKGTWREEAGHLVTDIPGAAIYGNLDISAQAIIEFEISWPSRPNFIWALGTNSSASMAKEALRLEVWDRDLVAVLETDTEADLAVLDRLEGSSGQIHLRAYLNRDRNRILFFSETSEQLADLHCTENIAPVLGSGVRLINQHGTVRLERLHISGWNGTPPHETEQFTTRIDGTDGAVVHGQLQEFDPATQHFVVRTETKEAQIALSDIETMVFASSPHSNRRNLRTILWDGTRLSGSLVQVDNGHLWLKIPSIREPVGIPISKLQGLLVLESGHAKGTEPDLTARLELAGVRLTGVLVDGHSQNGTSCLVWKPRGSKTASPIRAGVSGQIIYCESAPRPAAPAAARPQRRQQRGILGFFFATPSQPPTRPTPHRSTRSLYLRTGDMIPCEVDRIDDQGLTFRTPISDATFVDHDQIKAVELAPVNLAIKVNKTELARLLTLPRMQKNNPPTHLIRSTNGDCLRCRILALDDRTCTAEVRLENRQLDRDRIARIIWLHDDELDPVESSAPAESTATLRVQAVRSNGIRLTFTPQQIANAILSGTSTILGNCRIDLKEVDRLLIGSAIDHAAAEIGYYQWKLHHARQPRFVSTDSSNGGEGHHIPGTGSALVGTTAPDFQVPLLDGNRFQLSDHEGTILVLDFWTTWCGPCIQSLPEVDRIVREFEGRGVRLIAVNLQEAPDQISATLDRLELQTTVALDQDGAIAEKYGATAIPHTVIIDADGTIARLFIGGGPQVANQIREALNNLLAE